MILDIVGRAFGSTTVATMEENGNWTVVVSMNEKRLQKGMEEWEEQNISTQCTDSTFEKAYSVAMTATLEKFSAHIEATKSDSLFPIIPPEATELLQ